MRSIDFGTLQGRRFVNVYFGHGVQYDPKRYTPQLPAPLQSEWKPPSEVR